MWLTLPVLDSYEALPVKVLEVFTLLQAVDERCGILKIDDDLVTLETAPLKLRQVAQAFAIGDYMGSVVFSPFHDRIFHMGKCQQPTPPVYGKPVKTPWARGALYYLSAHALNRLTTHYLRFPGCLEGEIYEDKAVADVLHDNGIVLTGCALEPLLGLDSARQEAPPLV